MRHMPIVEPWARYTMSLLTDEEFMLNSNKSELANFIINKYTFDEIVLYINSEKWKELLKWYAAA